MNNKLRQLCQKYNQIFMDLDNIFLKKHDVNMDYFKIDKIHLNIPGTILLSKEIKRQISYCYIYVYQYFA